MTERKNILFLCSWYPNKNAPFDGNFIQRHAETLSEQFNIFVLHATSAEQKEDFITDVTLRNGLTEVVVYYKKVKNKIPLLSQFQKYQRYILANKRGYQAILQEAGNRIDLVHLNVAFPAGLFALYLKKRHHLKYILTEHWTIFLKESPNKISPIEKHNIKRIGNEAACVCPVSEHLGNEMQNFGIKNNFRTVYNVVDETVFKLKTATKAEETKFLHISNFKDEHKNISGILRAVKKLSEIRDDFVFTIVGDGNLDELLYKIKVLNIPAESLKIEGKKSPAEVADLMNENDVFVLFSNYETASCVVEEALMCGLPIISTNVGIVPESVNETNGLIVEKKNEADLFKKLAFFIENRSKYDALKIRDTALKKFGKSKIAADFSAVYEQVLSKN